MRPEPEQLSRIPLFASLSGEQLAALARLSTVREAEPGVELVVEGAPGYAFFIVEEGSALVTSGGDELRQLGPGDFFGEIAVLETGERTATVTAATHLRVIVMLGRDFRMLERDWPDASELVRSAMAERIERSERLGHEVHR
jgi:CRP/FNR family transcriptional regulator, cyclic AMP receptor protein